MTIRTPCDNFCNFQVAVPAAQNRRAPDDSSVVSGIFAIMISIDWSLLPAILIFILTVVALNYLLFRPVTRIQAERAARTTGLMSRSRSDLEHHLR